jgi:hypothetical protein
MLEVAAGTDPQEATTTPPQGTGAPADDLPQSTEGEGAGAAPKGFDEEWLKTLDTASRQSFDEKFVPKAVFTQKTQALAEDRKKFENEKAAMFELARRAIADRPTTPTGPTAEDIKRKELLDLATAGDGAAMQQLIQMEAERQVMPIKTQVALQNAAQAARTAPGVGQYVTEHWNEIIQTMQTDPVIAQLATANNYAAADRVMIALGLEHQVRDLVPKYEAATKEIESLKLKLSAYERERAASLPSSTSRAGTTGGRPTAGEPQTLEEAALKAWLESGGTQADFR